MITVGVDLGIRKVAWAIYHGEQLFETGAYESTSKDRCDQLEEVSNYVGEVIYEAEADYVFIEDTLMGNNRKYSIQLSQMMGAVLANLSLIRREHLFMVYLVNNKSWKKETVGNGNAKKEEVKNYISELSGAYAALCGDDQDQYDAACIGLYGVGIVARAEELMADR